MLYTDAAQQRPGNLPASAPEVSQPKPPRAQEQAHPGRPAAQRRKSQLAGDRTAGTMGTSHISVIHDGPAQPPPWNITPHASTQTLQKVLDLTKIGRVQHERRAQLARYYPLGEGHEQARSVIRSLKSRHSTKKKKNPTGSISEVAQWTDACPDNPCIVRSSPGVSDLINTFFLAFMLGEYTVTQQ